jgi:hypothetical protein
VGIQAVVVFVGLGIAMLVGALAGTLAIGGRTAAWLAIGVAPLIWVFLSVTARAIGRPIWQYTAPYPYRWMEVTSVPRPPAIPQRAVDEREIRLAA